jgi:hypothetical protein
MEQFSQVRLAKEIPRKPGLFAYFRIDRLEFLCS